MTDIICFVILCLAIVLVLCISYLLDVLRLRRLIKEYNKRFPDDPRDPKKTTPWSMNKQFIDWQISNFAKRPDGFSPWEKYEEWKVDY